MTHILIPPFLLLFSFLNLGIISPLPSPDTEKKLQEQAKKEETHFRVFVCFSLLRSEAQTSNGQAKCGRYTL